MSREDGSDSRERQFLPLCRRVMLLLSWLGLVVLSVVIVWLYQDQSFEVLPLGKYNWWLWSGGKLDLPFTPCDRLSRPCVRLVMPLLVAVDRKSEGKCCSSHSLFPPFLQAV